MLQLVITIIIYLDSLKRFPPAGLCRAAECLAVRPRSTFGLRGERQVRQVDQIAPPPLFRGRTKHLSWPGHVDLVEDHLPKPHERHLKPLKWHLTKLLLCVCMFFFSFKKNTHFKTSKSHALNLTCWGFSRFWSRSGGPKSRISEPCSSRRMSWAKM